MFCAPGPVIVGTERVGSRFHALLSRAYFRRHRERRVPLSCFALPDSFLCFALPISFSMVPRASGPILKFCTAKLIFGGTEDVGSHFNVLCSRSGPVFMCCSPGLIFHEIEVVGSYFVVLRRRTSFRRYLGRRVPLSCFALSNSFSSVPRASCTVIWFCAPGPVFVVTEHAGSCF
jgi:hypothetical protein